MHWQLSAYSYLYFLAGVVTLVTAWMNWRRRDNLGMKSLATALFFVALWALAGGIEMAATEQQAKVFAVTVAYITTDIFVNLTLLFVLQYYHHEHWLTPPRRLLFWLIPAVDALVVATNGWHHWVWQRFVPGPAGSNLIFYQHGPAYYVSVAYQTALVLLTVSILGYEIFRARGRKRDRAIKMVLSLLMPLFASLVYVVWPNHTTGLDLMPIGFSIGGLFISWIAFEDLQLQVTVRTGELEDVVHILQAEIESRRQLETDLRRTRDSLATHLADQSQKLAGLYNLILMANQPLEMQTLLSQSLARIRSVLGCRAVCFYCIEPDGFELEAQQGLPAATQAELQRLPTGWLPDGPDVRADVNIADSTDLPPTFTNAGLGACLFKRVNLPARKPGLLGAVWGSPHSFAVEDIALFGTLADGLGVILENSRLRTAVTENAIAAERKRLARDLHDSVTQSLHSLVLSAETANHLRQSRPDHLEGILRHLAGGARQALKEMRLLLYELQLTPSRETDLAQALQTRLDAVEHRAGIDVQLEKEAGAAWPPAWEDDLYLIAVEALNNAIKHARASRVAVRLCGNGGGFQMHVIDDGCAFDPDTESGYGGGMGLKTMAERAEKLGGRLKIDSQPGEGTCVSFVAEAPAVSAASHSAPEDSL